MWDRALGLVALGVGAEPTSINAKGLVGGTLATNEDLSEAFLWEPATGVRVVGRPADWAALELATVNDAGQFAGTADERRPGRL